MAQLQIFNPNQKQFASAASAPFDIEPNLRKTIWYFGYTIY